MMTHCADPRNTPELLMLREHIRGWRFYDQLRTDARRPPGCLRSARIRRSWARRRRPGRCASDDRRDWRRDALTESVADAFPGAGVSVTTSEGWFDVQMHQHGLLRPLKAAELSDGTLRYLLWVAALLTPRPPGLLVLNEPETSLHPDLLPALGSPDRACRRSLAGPGRLACARSHRRAAAAAGMSFDRAGQDVWRNHGRGCGRPFASGMAMASSVAVFATPRRSCPYSRTTGPRSIHLNQQSQARPACRPP